nr:hypothetical protein [Nanoarchaeum sp.]
MEQYYMPKHLDFKNLRFCLDNYKPTFLYIRDCGGVREDGIYSPRGRVKVSEDLTDKILDFRKDDSGLYMLVDSRQVFHFPLLKEYLKGFTMAYERIEHTEEGVGRMIMLCQGIDPYDSELPEPRKSTLRIVLDYHLMEIDFEGRIDIKFHSWLKKPYWKTWTVDKNKIKPNVSTININ